MGDVAGLEREYAKNKSVLSARNPEGRTALHLAALHAHPHVLRLLFSYGMCAAITDAHGQSALHIAAQASSTEVVEILLKDGSGCSIRDNDGKTALAYAYQNAISKNDAFEPRKQHTSSPRGIILCPNPSVKRFLRTIADSGVGLTVSGP
jgi:hypothetical protein